MPYDTFPVNDEYCNYKVDENGNRTGESLGCFDTQGEASDQLTAIRMEEHGKSFTASDADPLYSSTPVSASFNLKEMEDGRTRWVATYSNNIRDRDNPPEILSGESHKRVVYMTDKGIVPYPELWVWHEKSWHIGSVDWLAVDEVDNFVFAMASGFIREEAKEFAREIANQDVALSHGMYPLSIERSDDDPTIITGYIDHEISLLPRKAAANPLTSFAGLQDQEKETMAVNSKKRDALEKEWPGASGPLSEVEEANKNAKDVAKEIGLETKEEDTETEATSEDTAPEGDAPRKEGEGAEEEGGDEAPEKSALTAEELRDEVVDAIKALNERFAAIETAITAHQEESAKEIQDLRKEITESKKREKQRNEAPMSATLASLVNGKSAIGKKETKVDETDDNMEGPEETEDVRGKGLFFEKFL